VPIRIYALAKDMKIDSKDLVDLCTKAGIPGKGSALASLEDFEVEKLKAYLAAGQVKPAAKAAATGDQAERIGAPTRPAAPIRTAPPVITNPRPPVVGGTPKAPPKSHEHQPEPAVEPPQAPTVVAPKESPQPQPTAPPAVVASAPPTPQVDSPSKQPTPESGGGTTPPDGPARRDDFARPASTNRPIRVIGSQRPRPGGGAEGSAPRTSRAPVQSSLLRLAKPPEVKNAAPTAAANEPKAQKPEIRLKPGDMKGARPPGSAAGRAPLNAFAKGAADKRKPGDGPQRPGRGPAEPQAPVDPASAKGGRGDRKTHKAIVDDAERGAGSGLSSARRERQRQLKLRPDALLAGDDDEKFRGRRRPKPGQERRRTGTHTRKEAVVLQVPCSVRAFSEAAGIPTGKVLMTLMQLGMSANINSQIDKDFAELLAADLGVDVQIRELQTMEQRLIDTAAAPEDADESLLEVRPPIVTFLGHVDHGKTSLLDRIIGINVVSGEAGGITQHIRAYQIERNGRKVSFVDTPGHEAFTEMRARGANVTDIVVLVVAADDGLMPQTEEAISHAKAAEVPIVVALNKIDLPGVNIERIYQQLAAKDLLPTEWGGQTEVVKTSALTGDGIDNLLETLLIIADIEDFKANPSRTASGTCLEAEQEPGRGVIAKLMVQNGTLKIGDTIVCGSAHGRVKAMFDTLKPNKKLKEASPSMPCNITGLDLAPEAGDKFYVLEDIAHAREIASQRANKTRVADLSGSTTMVSFDEFQKLLTEGRLGEKSEKATLNLILRADTRGSIEAITKEMTKLEHPEVQVKILQASVGGISVADVTLASASNAVIVGFNVIPDEAARALADDRHVEIRKYDIIYKVTDDIRALLEGKLKPEERVVDLGRAVVKQVFSISRIGTIAGCQVLQGTIERNCRIRVYRDNKSIGDYRIGSLKREKDDAKEVSRGMECGIRLDGFNDIKKDDLLEAYRIEEVARTLGV
jgi:translation initiation factor IF-2